MTTGSPPFCEPNIVVSVSVLQTFTHRTASPPITHSFRSRHCCVFRPLFGWQTVPTILIFARQFLRTIFVVGHHRGTLPARHTSSPSFSKVGCDRLWCFFTFGRAVSYSTVFRINRETRWHAVRNVGTGTVAEVEPGDEMPVAEVNVPCLWVHRQSGTIGC